MNDIIVNRSSESTVEFDIKIDGASVEDATARFFIHTTAYDVSFPCSHNSQGTFSAKIPPIPFVQKGVADCSVEVIVNGQVFKPLSTTVTVVDNVNVSVASTGNKGNETPKTIKGEEDEEESITTAQPSSILKFLQTRNAHEEEEVRTESVKDKKVRNILESMNITTPAKKPARKTSTLKELRTKKSTK